MEESHRARMDAVGKWYNPAGKWYNPVGLICVYLVVLLCGKCFKTRKGCVRFLGGGHSKDTQGRHSCKDTSDSDSNFPAGY